MGRFTRGVKKTGKSLFNVPLWMGWGRIKENGDIIGSAVRRLLAPTSPKRKETFEQAAERLHLTEDDIQKQQRSFFLISLMYLLFMILVLAYAIYLAKNGHYRATIACGGLAFALMALVFRYSFWLFQVKQRRLGCTFKEWVWWIIKRQQ